MKEMKAVLLISLLILGEYLFVVGNGQVIELKIDKKGEYGLNGNDISNVKLLPLETNQNSLIGEISDIQMDGSNIFVLDRKNQVLKRFDKNGRYLNDIGRQGKGPGEFINLFCFCVLPGKNMVIISDQIGVALRFYTFEGKHVLDFKMAASAKKIMALDASMIVCHHGKMSVLKKGNGSFYEVAYYDFKGTPGPQLFPFSQMK